MRPPLVVLVVLLDLLARRVLKRHLISFGEAGENFDPFQRGDPCLHRDGAEVFLPMIGEPDELGSTAQAILGIPDLIGPKPLLQLEGNRLPISPLEGLERNGERSVALLSEDLDVRAHSSPKFRAQPVELYFHLEDLYFFEQLRRRRDE